MTTNSSNTDKSQIYLYKRMFKYIKPYLTRFIIAMTITIPIGALDAVMALALRPYMDNILVKQNIKAAWYIPMAIVGFAVVQGLLNYISTYMNGWLTQKIINDVKYELFSKLLKLESKFFDKNNSGNIIARFNSDPDNVTSGLLSNAKTLFTRVFSSISLVAVLLYNSWQLAIIAVSVIAFIIVPMVAIRKKVKKTSESLIKTSGFLMTKYNETFAGNKLIASYNLSDYQLDRFQDNQKDFFNLNMKITKLNGWLTPFMNIVASVGIAIVIGYGSYLIISKQISSGAFVSFITALVMLYTPVKSIGNVLISAQMSFLSVGRILDLFDYNPEIQNKNNAIKIPTIKNNIKFENVWFGYEKNKLVLKDINLDVKMGETIAFVGNSGSGKSTLINLIPRFYDVLDGKVTIDGIDIRDIDLYSLRENFAVVFQDNFLFDGTIKENILLGKQNATDEELNIAVVSSYLDEFITNFKDGLDTQIGERGVLLSGGQKQRIAIARALLKNTPVVILDEATSALDNKSEAIVQKAIDKLMQNRTVFVIAHRLSTVQNATKIVVMDNGHVVEIGTHEELVQRENGAYRALYYAQFKEKENISV